MTKSSAGKAGLEALRRRAQDTMREMDELLRELNNVLGDTAAPRARRSPFDDAAGVTESTGDLRVGNGNLSAERVAKLYGVSLSELAGWLKRSRQTVSKTPDADSLQSVLGFFERVARLRAVVKSDEAFRKWLRTPQDSLDDEPPLRVMAQGEWQTVADYVDDMLTGAPE